MRDQLLALAKDMTAFVREVVPTMMLMHSAGISPRAMAPSQAPSPRLLTMQSTSSWLRRAQEAGRIAPGSSDAIAALLVGSIEAQCFVEHLERRRRKDDVLNAELVAMIDALWRGVAPEHEHEHRG